MTAADLQSGELFEGRYRVEGQVGTGGFSKVYSARDERQGVQIALKLLTPLDQVKGNQSQGNLTELADRFLREARVLSTLRNPHSIIMYDHGQAADGQLYMVFEFIKGRSVFEMIRDDGGLPPHVVAKVLEGTLRSLQDAHSQGLLHRDIKPNNLMLAEQSGGSVVKVLDFGIAKAYGDAAGADPGNDLTAAGVLVGTPRYMPPEQLRGEVVGPAGDIYSLGIVAVEMLTGQKAIMGRDRLQVIAQQISPQSIQLPLDLPMPFRLRQVVERMIAKNTHVRYGSAAEILRDLKIWSTDEPLVAPGDQTEPVVSPVADKTFVATVKTSDLPVHNDEATVLQTVNIAELDRAIAAAGASGEVEIDRTVADPGLAASISQEFAVTREQAGLATRDRSWAGQNRSRADQSSNISSRADQSSNISASFRASPDQSQPFGNISSQADSSGQIPWDTGGQASLSARQQFAVTNADATGNMRPAFALTNAQKAVLVASCFFPGLAHIVFGQPKKGALLLVLLILSIGTLLFASLAVAFDAYLVLRAKGYRAVGEFEFFPDYKNFFG